MHNRKLKSKNIVIVFLVMALTLLNLQTISILAENIEKNKSTSFTENSTIKDNSNLTDKSVKKKIPILYKVQKQMILQLCLKILK